MAAETRGISEYPEYPLTDTQPVCMLGTMKTTSTGRAEAKAKRQENAALDWILHGTGRAPGEPPEAPAARMLAPDAGAIVEHGLDSFGKKPQTWRVNSWMCRAERPAAPDGSFDNVMERLLWEASQPVGKDKVRMRWCSREEATHVGLSGVCGTIAPIGEVKVIGMVAWDEATLARHRREAIRRGELRKVLF